MSFLLYPFIGQRFLKGRYSGLKRGNYKERVHKKQPTHVLKKNGDLLPKRLHPEYFHKKELVHK